MNILLMTLRSIFTRKDIHDQNPEQLNEIAAQLESRGNQYFLSGQPQKAIQLYLEAIKTIPQRYSSHIGLGMSYLEQRKYKEAELAFNHAHQLDDSRFEYYVEKSKLLLINGNFERGFSEFAKGINIQLQGNSKYAYLSCNDYEDLSAKRLTYDIIRQNNDFSGKTLLICTICGLGDTLMMLRFIPIIKERYKFSKIIVLCELPLIRITQRLDSVDQVFVRSHTLNTAMFDYQCPTMCLPDILQATPPSPSPAIPYLSTSSEHKKKWVDKLTALPGLKIGLAWAGNPELVQDAFRSIPLKTFAPMMRLEGITWISLQKGASSTQLSELQWPVIDWTHELEDMYDTAALIECLDLIVGVDTSVIHLAGALGKTVWLLNRYGSEWRWMKDDQYSPWYPNIRIFRQKKLHDWESIINHLTKELKPLIQSSPTAYSIKLNDELTQSSLEKEKMTPSFESVKNMISRQNAEIMNARGNMFFCQKDFEQAEACYKAAINLCPSYADPYSNLGNVYLEEARLDEIDPLIEKALAYEPGYYFANLLKLQLLVRRAMLEHAAEFGHKMILLYPEKAEIRVVLADVYKELKLYEMAKHTIEEALSIQPALIWAHNTHFHIASLLEDFQTGWNALFLAQAPFRGTIDCSESEYIAKRIPHEKNLHRALISQKNILFWTDWGLGDSLLFLRYLDSFRGKYHPKTISIACEEPLIRIFKNLPAADNVICISNVINHRQCDYHASLLALPYLLTEEINTIPAHVPYISVPDEITSQWKHRINTLKGFKIGLVWGGGEKQNIKDAIRSIALKQFEPLFNIPDITWISLQKGKATDQLKTNTYPIIDWTDELNDLMDTAGLIENLDLTISIDTSVINLVGALGRPGWVLNRYGSEWRWSHDVNTSPWYPSLRLFNQSKLNDWDSVISTMTAELQSIVNSHSVIQESTALQKTFPYPNEMATLDTQ